MFKHLGSLLIERIMKDMKSIKKILDKVVYKEKAGK